MEKKKKIGVSACLLGNRVRYDGKEKGNPDVMRMVEKAEVYVLCPEVFGGLPVPRIPAERKSGRIIRKDGVDVTAQYMDGSRICLDILVKNNIGAVVLKQRSPACGSRMIYDGSFSGKRICGMGVFAELCKGMGICVFDETETDAIERYLEAEDD